MDNNGKIIPEIDEQNVSVQQENATFMVIGDKAYTSEIIEEYNRNAAAKTEEFNTNATNKTNDFNTNYANKLKAFNDNTTTKTTDFDSHVTAQTTNFNNNAETATANFNKNVVQQTDEFNKNAVSYSQGIEENKENIVATSNELYRLKTDVLETGETTDSLVNIEDSAWSEMQQLEIEGVCKQNTTTGKNLLKIDASGDKDDIYSVVNSGDLLCTSKNLTAGTYKVYLELFTKPTVNTTFSGYINNTNIVANDFNAINDYSLNTIYEKSITIDEDSIISYKMWGNTDKDTIKFRMWLLNADERNTAFEPYTGGKPSPNPDYPQEITTVKNNLKIGSCSDNLYNINDKLVITTDGVQIDEDDWITITCNNSKGTSTKYFDFKTKVAHNIKTDTKYDVFIEIKSVSGEGSVYFITNQPVGQSATFSGNSLANLSVGTIKSTMTTKSDFTGCTSFLNSYATFAAGQRGSITFRISVLKENAKTISNFVYQPYISSQIEAKIPENEFIGYIDSALNNVHRIYKDTLNVEYNMDDGLYHLILKKSIRHLSLAIKDMDNDDEDKAGWKNVEFISDDFPGVMGSFYITTGYIANIVIEGIQKSVGSILYLPKNIFGLTQTEWKEKYPNLVLDLYYGIPENKRYTLDLGTIDMPLTFDEITNIYTDSNLLPTINAKYYRNFIKTIQNLQVNDKALKQELVDISNRLTALETAQANLINDIPTEESEVTE